MGTETEDHPSDPIFIHGITQRSGTNFLFQLLCLHPACDPGGPIWENYMLSKAHHLVDYAEAVYGKWNVDWQIETKIGPPNVLLSHLGKGLISYLNLQRSHPPGSKLITKTPSIKNLSCFFRLFPRAPLLIVIRDGRAVVESGMRSFGWHFEFAVRYWANAANAIIQMEKERGSAAQGRYLLVKYEDLYLDPEQHLRRIFAYIGVDPERYDYGAAKALPIFGSSELVGERGEDLHWKPTEKLANFDPLARWRRWDQARHERFNWIAGRYLTHFGYEPLTVPLRRISIVRNQVADLAWPMRRRIGRAARKLYS